MLFLGRSEKWMWAAHGFMDSTHDLAEHGLDAERLVLAGGRVVGLERHYGSRKETRRKEDGVRIIIRRDGI